MSYHDQLFKDLIRTFFPGFLRLVVPDRADRLRLGGTVFLDKEVFTGLPRGERREADLVAKVPVRRPSQWAENHPIFHVEIEAEARAGIGRRLWSYNRQLQQRHEQTVLTILVTLKGGRPGLHSETVRQHHMDAEVGTFTYLALGLEGAPAEDFLAFPEPPAWALAALMRSEGMSRAAHKLACKRPIAAAAHLGQLERLLLENFVETYVELTAEEVAEYELLCASEENREVRAMELTWQDRMEAQLFEAWAEKMRPKYQAEYEAKYEAKLEAGREEGRKEGREEGREEAARQLLLRQLLQRFGPLPEEVRRRIEAIGSFERLQELADRILIARSLEEMELV